MRTLLKCKTTGDMGTSLRTGNFREQAPPPDVFMLEVLQVQRRVSDLYWTSWQMVFQNMRVLLNTTPSTTRATTHSTLVG